MKKFKSILCGALAFVAGSVALSACGAKTEPNETPTQQQEQQQEITVGAKTTISLAEAKEIIVKALAINDNSQTQSLSTMALQTASAEEGNRDIMEKLGKFTCTKNIIDVDIATNKEFKNYQYAKAYYKNGNFQKYYSNESGDTSNVECYYDGLKCYDRSRGESSKEINRDFKIAKALFDDKTFDRVYNDTATKETNQDGYSITLTGDLKSYYHYIYILSNGEESQFESIWNQYEEDINNKYSPEDLDKCHFYVTINMGNNNSVSSATVNVVCLASMSGASQEGSYNYNTIENSIFTFTSEPNLTITEPDWVTEYKQAHA